MPGSSHYTGTWSPSPGSPWVGARGTRACSGGMEVRRADHTCIARTTAGLSSHCPTSYTLRSRREETWGKRREVFPMVLTTFSRSALKKQTSPTRTLTASVSFPVTPSPGLAHRKNVWCSMQTFHSLLADRWFGSLKPIVLSNCSYCKTKKGG